MSNFRIFEHSKVQMSRKYSKIPKHFLKKLQKSQTLAASQCFCLALRLVTLCCLELNLYSKFIRVDHDSTGCYERQTDKLCYGSFNFFTTFKNFRHFRHTTGRMKLIMTTGRDNRFVFRESNFKKSRS